MLELYEEILIRAEKLAKETSSFGDVMPTLRELPFEDFGLLLLNMPNPSYPNLSKVLPAMTSAEVQKLWTGSSGIELYQQTASFVRLIVSNYARYRERGLQDRTIMDFGVGYGRIFRLMYYFSNADKLWGVDAWDRSLEHCRLANLPGNFVLSQPVPEDLPVGDKKFDLIFSYSVFTHLSPKAATACLSALRKHIASDGLLIFTFRPIEFWRYIDGVRNTNDAKALEAAHRKDGYAYLPHNGAEGETYGDISFTKDFLDQAGWKLLGLDRSISDLFQVACILEPN